MIFVKPSLSNAGDEWSTTAKSLFATKMVFHTVDMFQTVKIYESDDFYERNPVLDMFVHEIGEKAIPIWFVGTGLANYLVADFLPNPYREAFLVGSSAVSLGLVLHNHAIGIRMSLGF